MVVKREREAQVNREQGQRRQRGQGREQDKDHDEVELQTGAPPKPTTYTDSRRLESSLVLLYFYLNLEFEVFAAWTQHIRVLCAHICAETFLPAHAHSPSAVFFDAAMSLIVSVFPNRNVLKARNRAFEVALAAESFLFDGAVCFGSGVVVGVSELQQSAEGAVNARNRRVGGVVEAVLVILAVAASLKAGVVEDTVGVSLIAEGDLVGTTSGHELG